MGVEVKGAGDGVVIADRGCNDNCCCGNRNSGWGSGWGAPEFDEFRQYIDQRITTQETLLQRIAQELGLDKPKQ